MTADDRMSQVPDPPELARLMVLVEGLGSGRDVWAVLDGIAVAAREAAAADLACVTMREPGGGPPRVVALAPLAAGAGPLDDPAASGAEMVAVPIVVEQEAAGQIVVSWRRGVVPADLDRAALGRLARFAALALRQARLAAALTGGRAAADVGPGDLVRIAAQLRGTVDAASDAIVTTDAGGAITSVNPAGEAMFGFSAPALLGQPLVIVLPGLSLLAVPAAGQAARTETEAVRRDGSRFPAELSASTVAGESGASQVVIVRDVTERKAAERLKDEFVATVSHELRTLTALRGHLELVLDGDAGPVSDLQRRFLGIASQSADRLGALINDLLDVAKIEAGKVQFRRELLDLAAVLHEVAATFRIEAERRGLAFRDFADLPPVVGDRARLVQVFGNLVSNAIKYTPSGEVTIQARPMYGAVEIVVRDTGVGMREDEQRQLFTKFFRSRDRAGRDPGGTGLGLVIAKGMVEGHGGTIAVESEHGVGTRLRVILPAGGGALGEQAEPGRETTTVLVVDDEVALRDLLLEYLRMWGYRGIPASDGAEGLALARRLAPDLVILDVGMLPMSGLDVLRQLKEDSATRRIPVLLHSVADRPDEMMALGAADFLQKPVSATRLREAILRALDRAAVPVYVADGDLARGERVHRALEETGVPATLVRGLAEARAIPPTPLPVVVLGPHLADGPAASLLAAWAADPAFRGAEVLLLGSWPAGSVPAGPGCRTEALQGQRAADAAARVRALVAERRRGGVSGGGWVLLAEDEAQIGEMVAFKLVNAGHEVMRAWDGEETLAAANRERPDVIILDVMMPVLDGFSVLGRLKADPDLRTIPVIMLTARGQERDVLSGLQGGAADYIVKPFSLKEFLARVEVALRRR